MTRLNQIAAGWWDRFGWAEICGSLAAALGFAIGFTRGHSLVVSAGTATLAEVIGFNGFIAIRAVIRAHRANRHLHGWRWATTTGWHAISAEADCVVAEAIDDLFFRPFLIYQFTSHLQVAVGFLVGKVLSDVAYYRIAWGVRKTQQAWRRYRRRRIGTPYLLLNPRMAVKNFLAFREVMPFAVYFALKCCPHKAVLKALHAAGCLFEVASWQELKKLIRIGVDPATVLFSNPLRIREHTRRAYRAGLRCFAADSEGELERLAAVAPESKVYIRLATQGAGAVGSEGKFGVDPDEAVRLFAIAARLGLQPYGLAFHPGSQLLNGDAWVEPIRQCGEIMLRLQRDHYIELEMLDTGGGYGVNLGKEPQPLAAFADTILKALANHLPYQPRSIVTEPGRVLAASAGVMVATVNGVAKRGGKLFAHVDVSAFHGFMEALESGCTLVWPVYVDGAAGRPLRRYTLVGMTCDSQDTIMDIELPELQEGDKVRILLSGAYTFAYSDDSAFNDYPPPRVVPV